MSMNTIFITTAIAALGVASVASTANANNSRYGGSAVNAYESAPDCNVNPCHAAPVRSSRYGGEYVEQIPMQAPPAPLYVDCQQMNACGPQIISQPNTVYTQPPQPVYQQHAQVYTQPAPTMPVNCPAGTTAQADGTCLQTGHSSSTTYSNTTTYGSSSDYSGYDVVIDTAPAPAMPVNCPAGTTAQPDGTCLQGSTYGSTSTYSSTTTYSGDAESMAQTTTTPSYGYTSDGAYTASDYRPMRK